MMPATIRRFGRTERAVHWSVATLMLVCILTAVILYNGALSIRVGHRHAVELIHVYCGFALPVPILLGLVSRAYRTDLGRLNRFAPEDYRWLRSRRRRDGTIRVGKFNAGEKVNASLTAGATLVLLGTGILMFFVGLVRLSWRVGATFAHDWFALALGLLIIGHIYFAIRDPQARRGMRTGDVPTEWARSQHAAWLDELNVEGRPAGQVPTSAPQPSDADADAEQDHQLE
jgi:formate dehydrogenase subunit gamma